MSVYLIKSALCLLVLWSFYKIALEQQTAHIFKRYYLLSSLIIAFGLPFITITYSIPLDAPISQEFIYYNPQNPVTVAPAEETTDWFAFSLWAIYFLGVFVFGLRFWKNIAQIRSKIRQNVRVFTKNAVHILIDQNIVPHTFLNYIFLPRQAYDQKRIAPEILVHEQAHVDQKHTLDILFIELLQIIFWFNPLLVLLKKSVALNHEFLADQKALSFKKDPKNYINLLFHYAQGSHQTALTSAIDYSFTRPPYNRAKKRILMISQSFSAKKLATRLAFLVPILAFCIYFFNQEIVAKPIFQEKQNSTEQSIQKKPVLEISINNEKITVNAEETTINKFTKTIDNITAEWTKEEMMNYSLQLSSENGVDNTVSLLSKEFKKTKLYKTNPNRELIPPPPPPAPLDPSEYNSDNYTIAKLLLEGDEDIYIEGKKANLSNLEAMVRKNLPQWVAENKRPRALTIIQGNDTSEDRVQEIFKAMEGFQINSLNVIKQESKATKKTKDNLSSISQQEDPKTLHMKLMENKVWLEEKEIKAENLAERLNEITKDWSKSELKNARVIFNTKNPDSLLSQKLEAAYKKTKLYQAQPTHGLIPPPPPGYTKKNYNIQPPAPPVSPIPPPTVHEIPTPSTMKTIIADLKKNSGSAYLNGEQITFDKALLLMENQQALLDSVDVIPKDYKMLQIIYNQNKDKRKPTLLITDN